MTFRYQQEPMLRPRIKQVILLLAKGHKEPYIAYHLNLSLSTIGSYMTDIRQQYALGETPEEMIREALNRGLISEKEIEAV